MENEIIDTKKTLALILIAYLFSVAIRLIWVQWAGTHPEFFWNGQLMINTNDGYFFASGAQHALSGAHSDNPRIPGLWDYGVVALSTWLTKYTPFSLETIILYLPGFIASLVVVPIILIGRLFNNTLWGFLAALLGAVTWSYYNRTMFGYYDTDMFSAMAPMFILYFLMRSIVKFDLKSALYGALTIVIYPFLYDQGRSIVFAMGLIYAAYLLWHHRRERVTYESLILIFIALTPFKLPVPWEYLIHIVVVLTLYAFFRRREISLRPLMWGTGILLILFLILGDVFPLIWHKIQSYIVTGIGTEGTLHFFAVNQTVREAGKIPFEIFADRISGSIPAFFLSLIGYGLLLWRYRPFILSLPLMGIGFFAWWGGLRFTVYAVPVAALAAVYFFVWIGERFKARRLRTGLVVMATLAMLYPNIMHIIAYKVPTVFNRMEVKDLAMLNRHASSRDYTISWWDYGYPLWFYSDTCTLIDGGKHEEDNFIVSKILQTDSPTLAANLARLAVEKYATDPRHQKVAPRIFKGIDPNILLMEMRSADFKLPKKTREVYLYLPYRMLDIFPTVMLFGNLDLTTGKPLRKPLFLVTAPVGKQGSLLQLSNGLLLDLKSGYLLEGRRKKIPLRRLVVAVLQKDMKIDTETFNYHPEGEYSAVYMKSYRRVVLMDNQTFRSVYVQMFMLGKYDDQFFEPVVLSPYSRIYRLKR
jgi:dolichyl-diphosphooligosaccharide--protein glycosyltransferase/undecaprenyl-diphosphooligosaccharide--protein glycosyltransferase